MWTTVRPAGRARLTPGEEALWLLQRLAPELGVANVAVAMRAREPLRWWPLNEALRWLVARHPPLRARFPLLDGAPSRATVAAADVDVEVDVLDVPPERLADALREYAARPFDLEAAEPIRLGWFRAGAAEQVLCLVAHHIVIDPTGLDLLIRETVAGYAEFAATSGPPELPAPAPVRPAEPRAESLRFWRDELAGADPSGMRLSPGREPAGPVSFAAGEVRRAFPARTTEAVRALRARARATDSAVLLAAYLVALRGLGASDDALVGLLVNTRGVAGSDSLGYHTATLPLRVPIDPRATLADLATALTPKIWTALEHSDVSFEALAREVAAGRDDPQWWRTGLIRHLFNHRGTRVGGNGGPSVIEAMWEVHTGLSRFDLELTVRSAAGSNEFQLLYNTEVHDEEFARALLERIESVLDEAEAYPERAIVDLDPRTAGERELVRRVNDTALAWPGPVTVPALVSAVGSVDPGAVAIVDGQTSVSYGQLLALAHRVRAALDRHGVRPGDVVGVATPRGPQLAAAVLGVWFAGAAYLPLEAGQPGPWLRQQIDDAGARVILDGDLLPAEQRAGLVPVPGPDQPAGPEPARPEPAPVEPGSLAYLIYTSGSTGRPKGVRVTHGNLHNVVRHFAAAVGAGAGTRALWLTTFAFDISVLELALPLCFGGRVVTGPDEARSVPGHLADLVRRENVDVIQATPTTWRVVLGDGDAGWLAGRTVLCGGEPLPRALAERLKAAGCRALNVYGPTETTVWSTAADLAGEDPARLTVGVPIANTRAYVLDPAGRPRPVLVTGELCLAGDGVADGYHGQPELTARRFPTDPVLGRYYRTGDLARLLPDGRVELLGRRDRQVKLRGHRIELDEVENVLAEHPEVAAAAVVLHGEPDGDGYLAAFVVAADRPRLTEDVWAFASARLPSHRLPGRITPVARLPETTSGKVDRVVLASSAPLAATGTGHVPIGATGAAAGDELERRLLETWRDVLGVPDLGPDANFFLSGGSSLRAALLAERVSGWSPVPVPMMMVFQAPTPAALAALLRARASEGDRA